MNNFRTGMMGLMGAAAYLWGAERKPEETIESLRSERDKWKSQHEMACKAMLHLGNAFSESQSRVAALEEERRVLDVEHDALYRKNLSKLAEQEKEIAELKKKLDAVVPPVEAPPAP